MEKRTDFMGCGPAGVIHQVCIAPGHGRGAVPQQFGQGKFMFAGQGQPTGIGVAQRVEHDFTASVLYTRSGRAIESQSVNSTLKRIRNLSHNAAGTRRKNKCISDAWRQAGQGRADIVCHNRVSCLPRLAALNIQRAIMGADITPAQGRYFAKSQAAMQRDQRHAPHLSTASGQFVQQRAGLFRSQITFAPVICLGHLDLPEWQWAGIHFPCRHASHDAPYQSYCMAYGLRGISILAHARHEQIQLAWRNMVQPQRLKRSQGAMYQCFQRPHFFTLRIHPVTFICLPCGGKGRAWGHWAAGLWDGCSFRSDTRYQLDAQFVGESGCHALAGPAYDLPVPFALRIAIVYDKSNIGLAMVAPARVLRGEDAFISCGISFCHLVPIWCPFKRISAQKMPGWRHYQKSNRTSFAYSTAVIYGDISSLTNIDNWLFCLLSSWSGVRFLLGAPIYFNRIHPFWMHPVFLFGAHLVPIAIILASILFRCLLCAPASVALLVRPHKYTRSSDFLFPVPSTPPSKREGAPNLNNATFRSDISPHCLWVLPATPKGRGQKQRAVLAHSRPVLFLKFKNHASSQHVAKKRILP